MKCGFFKLHGQQETTDAALLTFNCQSSQKYSTDSLLYGRILTVITRRVKVHKMFQNFSSIVFPYSENADMNIHDSGPPLNHNKSVTMPLQEVFLGTEIQPDLHTISAFNFPLKTQRFDGA